MAPPKMTSSSQPGKDLRMFFGGSQSGKKAIAIPAASFKVRSQKKNATDISDSEEGRKGSQRSAKVGTPKAQDSDDEPLLVPSTSKRSRNTALIFSDDDDEDEAPVKKKPTVAKATRPRSQVQKPKPRDSASLPVRKKTHDEDFESESSSSTEHEDDEYNEDELSISIKKGSSNPVKKAARKLEKPSSTGNRGTASSKSKSKPDKAEASETSKSGEAPKKFNWAAAKAAKLAGPVAHGSKEVPNGAPTCLLGLSFVFTGELSSFSRGEATDLAKRYGGRVVLQPSSKTDFVVLGDNAGPAKLAAIKKHNINTLSEDEFLHLIATRNPKGAEIDDKTRKKIEKEEKDIKQAALEMTMKEQRNNVAVKSGKVCDPTSQLWTSRYAPQSMKDICGNKGQVEKLQLWLNDWSNSLISGFKKPGKNAMNIYRAVLITGGPGIGKTTSAHLCAKLAGYTPIELNASDARSKKLVENGMNINNTSLDGYLKGTNISNSMGVDITDKSCLIMDEVDGMSAGDRGGVGALNSLIRKTKIPIICIANDRQAQKLKPLVATTFSLPFHKPQVNMIRSRILTIAFKENMKIPANVIDQLIIGANSDIRQILNMLSIWKLSSNTMDFDESKNLAKMNEKYAIMTPFDLTTKILGPYLFSSTSRETLGEKMELYFQDHQFMPLFIQENYLKTESAKLRNLEGPEKVLKQLFLMDSAASSISDGDIVDALIHGPEQHWGLMPLHAVCSTIRPASFVYGMGAHYGGPNSIAFPQWLGQNSKQSKLQRQLGDVQIRMRLKVSGDKSEIRQAYIPALYPYIVKPLADQGTSAVDDVIQRLDEYFLSKEDWDTVIELGVGDRRDDFVLKSITVPTKTALTKRYNASEHPIPFHKAEDLGKIPKKLAGGPAPDLEEAFVDDVEDVEEEEAPKNNLEDVATDSLIQRPKKKKTNAPSKPKTKK